MNQQTSYSDINDDNSNLEENDINLNKDQNFLIPISTVLNILTATVSDPSKRVRTKTVKAFLKTPMFDSVLAQPCVFKIFSKFLNDEAEDVRNISLSILKRLKSVHPSFLRSLIFSTVKQMSTSFGRIVPESNPTWNVFPHILSASSSLLSIYANQIYIILMDMLSKRFETIKF